MERSTSVQNQVEEATPVISQGLENMSVQGEETLQTNTDPTELDECCNSSATESAPSDDEDISAFNMYEHVLTDARDPGASREGYSHSNEDLSEETDSEVEGNAKLTREIIRMMAELERRSGGQSTSRNTLAMRRATCRKRRCNSDDDDDTSDDERVLPTKRRATRDIVVTNSGDERQLPFSASMQLIIDEARKPECEIEPDQDEMLIVHNESLTVDNHLPDQKPLTIDDDPLDEESLNIDDDSVEKEFPALVQLRVVGVMEPGLKLDMSDDEEPMSDNDPLKAEAWFRYHCERATRSEATGTVSKTEPTNDDNLKVSKLDSLEQDNQEELE